MQKLLTNFLLVFILLFTTSTVAQEDETEVCSPEDISARVDEVVAAYQAQRENASDKESALDEVDTLQDDLDGIKELCANVSGNVGNDTDPGSGTLTDPFTFGVKSDTGQGYAITVTGYIRPADQIIRSANMFNDRPEPDQVYVIVNVEVECDESFSGRCEANYLNFELVGDDGTIYTHPYIVLDQELDVNLLAGGRGQGQLPFLISKEDTNLRLIYKSNFFSHDMVVFQAEPSLANGLQVISTANVNVRSGAGTNFSVSGSLPANTPVIAFARNADGTWLQITDGWVFTELVDFEGDVQSLPVTTQ